MENNNETPQPISIELTENIAEGTYSNLAVITHSTSEFVLDFIRVMPNVPKAKVQSSLMKALQENISKFEAQNGIIKEGVADVQFPMTFGGPQGQA